MRQQSDGLKRCAIYYLVDPRAPQFVRYVGQTAYPMLRHLSHCNPKTSSRKDRWILSLREDGLMPQMIIAEWVPEVEGNAAELRHIQAKASYYLTNEPGHSRPIMSEDQAQRPRTGALRSVKMEAGKAVLMMALDKSKWQIAPAARMLGICRPTVYGMIKAYGLVKPSNIRPRLIPIPAIGRFPIANPY